MKPLLALLALPSAALAAGTDQKPNIVVVFIDDLGANDLGMHNPAFSTPNIDAFAAEAVRFTHAYVPSPTSSPSRAGLLTGRHPLKTGLVRHIAPNETPVPGREGFTFTPSDPGRMPNRAFLPLEEETFAEALRREGYYTAIVGKWHLGPEAYFPGKQGFDHCFGVTDLGQPVNYYPPYFTRPSTGRSGEYLTDYLTDDAVGLIASHDYRKPLLLYFPHYAVHSPHIGEVEATARYVETGIQRPYADYLSMVAAMDRSVGRLLRAIEDKGIADNTVVIFASDQGGYFTNAPLKGGKMNAEALYEGGARVPMLIRHPAWPGGRDVHAEVSTLDLFPTLLDLAGADPAGRERLDGVSLLPALAGQAGPLGRTLFFYRSYDDRYASALRGGLKYIATRSGQDEAYDLAADPREERNVAGDPAYATRLAALRAELEAFLRANEPRPVE